MMKHDWAKDGASSAILKNYGQSLGGGIDAQKLLSRRTEIDLRTYLLTGLGMDIASDPATKNLDLK